MGFLAFFWLLLFARGAIIINEIMYHHPANEMFEFVELFNSDSAASVSLASWSLKIGQSPDFCCIRIAFHYSIFVHMF
jgi:hypothetical protein